MVARSDDNRDRDLIRRALDEARPVREESTGGGEIVAADDEVLGSGADWLRGYRLLREIQRGGQGVVYEALQEGTRRRVAVKVLRDGPLAAPAERARFEREVTLLAALSHPNIVTIHESGEAASRLYFVMDYISGEPLDVYMQSGVRSIESTLVLFGKIASAVEAAHVRGILHRDLKPSNVRVDR